jgi:succinate dehydrogenase hydrophobic anchor subunit
VLFLASFIAYCPIALACDSAGGGVQAQAVIGVLTWLFLVAAIWHAPVGLRVRVFCVHRS